jgi:hypothetical protein
MSERTLADVEKSIRDALGTANSLHVTAMSVAKQLSEEDQDGDLKLVAGRYNHQKTYLPLPTHLRAELRDYVETIMRARVTALNDRISQLRAAADTAIKHLDSLSTSVDLPTTIEDVKSDDVAASQRAVRVNRESSKLEA